MNKGQSAKFLRALRRKHGLGEFKTGRRRKRATRKTATAARPRRRKSGRSQDSKRGQWPFFTRGYTDAAVSGDPRVEQSARFGRNYEVEV